MSDLQTRYPEPPTNVQVVFTDGSVVPVDCTYKGWNGSKRTHVWEVLNPRPTEMPSALHIDVLPPNTSVTVSGGPDGL